MCFWPEKETIFVDTGSKGGGGIKTTKAGNIMVTYATQIGESLPENANFIKEYFKNLYTRRDKETGYVDLDDVFLL